MRNEERLLQPLYGSMGSKLRWVEVRPADRPPLVKLETALHNLALEVSISCGRFMPPHLHLRHIAVGSVSGDSTLPHGKQEVSTVQLHDPRILFQLLRWEGVDSLPCMNELARLFQDAPPEWVCLLAAPFAKDDANDPDSLRRRVWDGFAGEYVRDYLWLVADPLTFEPAVARGLFDQLAQRITRGRQRCLRITPLWSLWLNGQEVVLSPQVRLRPVTDFERHKWLNSDDLNDDLPVRGMEILKISSVIEFEDAPESITHRHSNALFNQLNPRMGAPEAAAVAALKLLAEDLEGAGDLQPVFMEFRVEGSIHEHQTRCSLSGPRGGKGGDVISLTHEQRQQLPALFERLLPLFDEKGAQQLTPVDRSLGVALSRYLQSFHRGDPKDWLIDCWVALEGLFTQRGEKNLTKTCATRVSQELVSLGGGSSQELHNQVKDSYNCRCEIVHGERALGSDVSVIAWRTRRQLGRILRHRLRLLPNPPG